MSRLFQAETSKIDCSDFCEWLARSETNGVLLSYMTHEKVEKQGRDDHCELSHKTALLPCGWPEQ